MSRTRHPRFWLRPRTARDAEDVVAGVLEYRDVVETRFDSPESVLDYTTPTASRAAFDESVTVHHRRPRRRLRERAELRRWRERIFLDSVNVTNVPQSETASDRALNRMQGLRRYLTVTISVEF